jgi:hypothetical protein
VIAAQEVGREGEGGRNTVGRMRERREHGEENIREKRMRADRGSCVYSGLEMHGWHVCTESSVVRLITLVRYVGAMAEYLKPRKYMNGEHEGGRETERCSWRRGCDVLFLDSIFPKHEGQCPRQQITQSRLRCGLKQGYRESNLVPYAESKRQPNELLHSQETWQDCLAFGDHASVHSRPPMTVPLLDIDI